MDRATEVHPAAHHVADLAAIVHPEVRRAAPAVRAPPGRAEELRKEVTATRPTALAFLPGALFDPHRPLRYVLLAWACAFLPSLLLSVVASQILPESAPKFPKVDPGLLLFLLVVFAPVLETLIMGAVLLVLDRIAGFVPAVLLSSLGWGIAHSLQAPAWGLVIWWPFLIFSITFLIWRRRSLGLAFGVPMLVHGLQNLGPALLLVSGLGR
jgi:membrane protease YdiL (CAAX protease family)